PVECNGGVPPGKPWLANHPYPLVIYPAAISRSIPQIGGRVNAALRGGISRQGGNPTEEDTMRKSILLLVFLVTAGLGATSRHLGGWAVVTVDDLPDYVVVGQPVRLSFVVRQHGMRPLDGLRPRVEAKARSVDISV